MHTKPQKTMQIGVILANLASKDHMITLQLRLSSPKVLNMFKTFRLALKTWNYWERLIGSQIKHAHTKRFETVQPVSSRRVIHSCLVTSD